MNLFDITFLVVNAFALLLLPRRWSALPLLIVACYTTHGQVIEIGPFNFTAIRLIIAAGLVRITIKQEWLAGRMNRMDRLMLIWSVWMLISSLFHKDPSAALINRLGLALDACGIYFLFRVMCHSLDDVVRLIRVLAILLLPVALEMMYEKLTHNNLFYALGGQSIGLYIREGHIRAQGPFAHSILAGTVGAVSLPLIVPLWHQDRKAAMIGIGACLLMIFTSASSGPIMSVVAGIGALYMWHHRHRMRLARWLAIIGYIGLDLIMNDPAYFIMARVDLVGGSTGWHRARLIKSAIEHLSDWWFIGTDYTRNWIASGVPWSKDHVDITNHYLVMGVAGGLPLMLLFIAILAKGFSFVGQMLRQAPDLSPKYRFMIWAFGASLFAHAVTFISVSYFDQSFVFIYLTLAAISSVWSWTVRVPINQQVPTPHVHSNAL